MITIGKRISLLRRAVFCLPPHFFAHLVGATREQLHLIENDQLVPSDDILNRISIITKTTRGWFLSGAHHPPTVNNWGYFELPWPGIESLGEAKAKAIADIEDSLRTDASEVIRDFGALLYHLAYIRNQTWRFLVLPLGSNGALILKVGDILWPAVENALKTGGASLVKTTEVTPEYASKIGSPRQKHTEPKYVIELFRMLGLDDLTNGWALDLDKVQECVWKAEKPEYRELVTRLAELLNSFPTEQIASKPIFNAYTRDELERLRPLVWRRELGVD